MDCSEQMHGSELGFQEYIEALEIERKKIQVFQRELPLCLELVTQTIERCKLQIVSTGSGATTTTEYLHGHQSDSEQTCSRSNNNNNEDAIVQRHVFEEFIPLKSTFSNDNNNNNNNNNDEDLEDEDEHESGADKSTGKDHSTATKKQDWLRSVQLWNDPSSSSDPPLQEELVKKGKVRNGGGFQPFQREKNVENKESGGAASPPPAAAATASDPAASSSSGGGGKREEQKDSQQRKQRRNWSPELHKRFLNALQQLGGSHAATPKQIRELMKVDGLTNDEVKSHLQKYRLHTRRPTQGIQSNGNAQTPQVVFVGGIWVPPSEYAAAVAAASGDPSVSGIYTPVATPAPGIRHVTAPVRAGPHKKKQTQQPSSHSSDERVSHVSECGVQHSNSPSTSSSTHTTTTSHAF